MILPIISMAIYNILDMPNLLEYQFMPYSDFYTSGGYGPNQVSTIFGLGIAALMAALLSLMRKTVPMLFVPGRSSLMKKRLKD